MNYTNNMKPIVGLILAFALAIGIGMWAGTSLVTSPSTSLSNNLTLAKVTQKFGKILSRIQEDYVEDIDLSALSEEAITKMLEQLDPHTVYITAEELNQSTIELEGIGVYFTLLKDGAYIVAPISGGPSEKVGIQAGDKILKIDDQPIATEEVTITEIGEQLRGPKGTPVKLTIARNGQQTPLDFTVVRDIIPFHSVTVDYMINDEVGYIKISRFTANTYKEFKTAFSGLIKQGMRKLMLDLRSNPGGYVEKAVKIANHVLDQAQLIMYSKGRTDKYSAKYYAKGKDNFQGYPIIILIDEGTASASEILAGALQDNDRALIVGRRSFGKGLVQAPIQLNDGSQLRLSVARYYTPSGRFIQRPYGKHTADYNAERIKRFKQGEYFRADHIQFDDTLKHQTSKKRIVYGGGGIMPDYFTPIDMSPNTMYIHQLSSFIQHDALAYADQHKEKLFAMSYKDYCERFTLDDFTLRKIANRAAKAGLPCEESIFLAVKERIKLRLKAHIARNIWSEKGFYPIYHQDDDELQKALQLFEEAEALLQQPVLD